MHEVINFSCSQASGHLITQLYNVQESHLPYTRDQTLTHTNDVYLVANKVKGKTNYYPRSINVEFQGGYGYLGKHMFREGEISPEVYGDVIVKKQERHVKNEYQANLDAGKPTHASLLSAENTTFWTDYNKLIYRPESLVSLAGFSHPEGTHKNFPRLKFDSFNVGEEEFKLLEDEIDDFFRKNLEQLDQVQGINFFSECDTAWAGFTNEMIIFLRDEYFSNGVSSKYNLWTYGLIKPGTSQPRLDTLLTRIRAVTELASNSTLFFPMAVPDSPRSFLSSDYDSSKMWHTGAVQSLFVNAIWGLNCQAKCPVSMATIENNLLRGSSSRNIVNEICLKPEMPEKTDADFGVINDVSIMDMYLNAAQVQQEKPLAPDSPNCYLNIGINPASKDHLYSKGIISKSQPQLSVSDLTIDTYVNPFMDEVTKIDSFPQILKSNQFLAEFSQTAALKPLLKLYRKVVERVRHPQQTNILGDKSELIESLSSLIEEYTEGYSEDSDYDD